MCAGKLLSLIKKCLNRERQQQKTNGGGCHSDKTSPRTSMSPSSHGSSHRKKAHQHKASSGATTLPRLPTSAEVLQCQPCSQMSEVLSSTAERQFCSTCRQPRYPPPFGDPVQHVVYVQSGRARPTTQLTSNEYYHTTGESYTPLNRDPSMDYPHHIQRTLDGEEGYTNSQRMLQHCDYDGRELFHAPPNKTVYESESPPPYRAHSYSMGHLDKPALHKSARREARMHTDWTRGPQDRSTNRGSSSVQRQALSSHRQEQLRPVLDSQGDDLYSFGDYSSPRTARVLSAPDSSHVRTSTYSSSHSSATGPPPYPPPEYSDPADIDCVFTSTVAPTNVTSQSVTLSSVTSPTAPCLHAS